MYIVKTFPHLSSTDLLPIIPAGGAGKNEQEGGRESQFID